jgi:hypothetical protein
MFFFPIVDSVEDLVPETIDKVAVPAILGLVVVVQAAAAAVKVVMAVQEDLVEVMLILVIFVLRTFHPLPKKKKSFFSFYPKHTWGNLISEEGKIQF